MLQSKLFAKTQKIPPREAEIASHKLLTRAGFISQLVSGIYSFLPLGWRVEKRIENIVRQEMEAIGGQEVFLPVLHPKELWQKTGRWNKMEPPLFKLKDRKKRDFCLGPTHEEAITDLVKTYIQSYKDLPLYLYQIQDKFRDELRPSGGLLRAREFIMKDLYSFHGDEKDLENFFNKVLGAYGRIYKRCGLKALRSEASGGGFTELKTYEFQVISEVGEDKVIYCPGCEWAVNFEVSREKAGQKCPKCRGKLIKARSIEVGHTFRLGTKYSRDLGVFFADQKGKKQPVVMGCYGIGLGRLMAAVVEINQDGKGIVWPKEVAPFDIHLIEVEKSGKVKEAARELYRDLQRAEFEVLYDDREEPTPGQKFAEADLIGIPVRLVVSEKTLAEKSVEIKERSKERARLIKRERLLKIL